MCLQRDEEGRSGEGLELPCLYVHTPYRDAVLCIPLSPIPSSSPLTIASRIPTQHHTARTISGVFEDTHLPPINKTNPIHQCFPFFHPDFRGVSGVSGACEDFGGSCGLERIGDRRGG